jgi:hypothetical protein
MVDDANAPTSQTLRQQIWVSRASGDIQLGGEGARAAVQAAILINGGAATAILAYLSKDAHTPPIILSATSWSLMGYAIGVFWGAIALMCSSRAHTYYGIYHMQILDDQFAKQSHPEHFLYMANRWSSRHNLAFAISMLFFIISSCWVAWGFLQAIKLPVPIGHVW